MFVKNFCAPFSTCAYQATASRVQGGRRARGRPAAAGDAGNVDPARGELTTHLVTEEPGGSEDEHPHDAAASGWTCCHSCSSRA